MTPLRVLILMPVALILRWWLFQFYLVGSPGRARYDNVSVVLSSAYQAPAPLYPYTTLTPPPPPLHRVLHQPYSTWNYWVYYKFSKVPERNIDIILKIMFYYDILPYTQNTVITTVSIIYKQYYYTPRKWHG